MREVGKGSRPRPFEDRKRYEANWDRIFGGVSSPCVEVCDLDFAAGFCRGCFRTLSEIEAWGFASDGEKKAILKKLEERKSDAKNNDG